MRMNRRNVLVGLGTIVAGGGAALGTGAFSSVEADRTVDVQTAGDSSALLQFSGSSTLVNLTGGNDSDLIQIQEDSLNKDAVTTANQAISVDNTGNNNVGLYVEFTGGNGALDILENGGGSIEGSTNSINLDSSGTANLDIEFDLTGGNTQSDIPNTVTFHADSSEYSP